MTRNGTAYRLRPLAPLTGATVSGSLPIPEEAKTKDGLWPSPAADDTGMRKDKYGQGGKALSYSVGKATWPTPTARDHKDTGDLRNVPEKSLLPRVVQRVERSWPTPTASEGTGSGHSTDGGKNLRTVVAESESKPGSLNPEFVEWLMGYEIGWTALPPSETPSSRRSRSGSGGG
jgi:hypothetical protein